MFKDRGHVLGMAKNGRGSLGRFLKTCLLKLAPSQCTRAGKSLENPLENPSENPWENPWENPLENPWKILIES